MLSLFVLYLTFLTYFDSIVTDEVFEDGTRVRCKYKISILVSMMSLVTTTLSILLLLEVFFITREYHERYWWTFGRRSAHLLQMQNFNPGMSHTSFEIIKGANTFVSNMWHTTTGIVNTYMDSTYLALINNPYFSITVRDIHSHYAIYM